MKLSPKLFWTSAAMAMALIAMVIGFQAINNPKQKTITEGAPSILSPSKSSDSSGIFKKALPGYTYHFPQDHASHPEFKTEWWYYTGHLKTTHAQNKEQWFGYELTFFRSASGLSDLPDNPAWNAEQFYMAHVALTDENGKKFYHTQRLNREAPGSAAHPTGTEPNPKLRAGAATQHYSVWNDNWSARQASDNRHELHASTPEFNLKLNLQPTTVPVVHGLNGVSQKAKCHGCASHYYSFPTMLTKGELELNGNVYPVEGTSWMDHEFGSNQLQKAQVGWDWFSVQLTSGEALMLYVMRRADGSWDPYSSGTWINKNGTSQHLSRAMFTIKPTGRWVSPHSKGVYPSGWQVTLPTKKLSLTIQPVLQDQELSSAIDTSLSYWEGRCRVQGTHNNNAIEGNAYAELTGYAKAFGNAI